MKLGLWNFLYQFNLCHSQHLIHEREYWQTRWEKLMLKRFELEANNTSVRTEFFGGLASFLASFYIIIVNPSMLAIAGLPHSAVLTGSVLIAAFSTILMGLYANNP